MSDNTSIEWSNATWNPILGCDRVSPGCDHCYAITEARIREHNPHPKVAAAFAGLTDRINGRIDWTGRISVLPERLAQPLGWRKPKRIFVNSLADMFHKDVPGEIIAQVFAVMAATPHHTYQLLTKRHARMRSLLSSQDFARAVQRAFDGLADKHLDDLHQDHILRSADSPSWPLPNLWLGVSVEDQHWADLRIPALMATPAAVRFLSCEPLLGPIDLAMDHECGDPPHSPCPPSPDWVIVGGESGPGARPMNPGWVRSLRDQCTSEGVSFFFKQWGSYRWVAGSRFNEETRSWEDHGIVPQRVSKKLAGRLLDGREWSEFPQQPQAGAA
jgi:protein gp37